MSPVRSYTNWNSRSTDYEKQIEPYRKYFFICEGANTETWYFWKLIDIRKFLNIHPLIDIRLLEKTEKDKDISFPRKLIAFAENQKKNPEISFDDLNGESVLLLSKIGFWNEICQKVIPQSHLLFQEDGQVFNELIKASALPHFRSDITMKQEGKSENRKAIPISDPQAHVMYYGIYRKTDKKITIH